MCLSVGWMTAELHIASMHLLHQMGEGKGMSGILEVVKLWFGQSAICGFNKLTRLNGNIWI